MFKTHVSNQMNTEIKKASDYLNINQQLDVKIEGILKALELK